MIQKAICIAFVLLGMAMSGTATINPGIKVRISQTGIQYAATQATRVLARDVSTMQIPNQSGSSGKFTYEIQNIHVTSFTPPTTTVTTQPFRWSLTGTSVSIHGDWHYWYKKGWIKISDHGSFDVSISVNIVTTVALGMDKTGRPTINTVSCSSDVTRTDVHLHGGASWLYNLFDHQISKAISQSLNSQLCVAITKVVNVDAAQSLATMPIEAEVGDKVLLNYALVSEPQFTTSYIDALFKGEFFWVNDKQESPFKPEPIPALEVPSQMISFWLTEYSINTLGYIEYKHNALQYSLTKADLPPSAQGILDTTCKTFIPPCIGGLLPALKAKYPNTSVTLDMRVTQAPAMSIDKTGLTGKWVGVIDFNVLTKNNQPKFVFSCDTNVTFQLTAAMRDQNITTTITSFDMKLALRNSTIGDVDVTVLNTVLTQVINGFVIPKLNDLGKIGFMLPAIENVKYQNPKLKMLERALFVTVDLLYVG